jgi:hypothetical protein
MKDEEKAFVFFHPSSLIFHPLNNYADTCTSL